MNQKMSNTDRPYTYCRQHNFILRPIHPDIHSRRPVTASFCKGSFQTASPRNCRCLPIFNHDHNSLTNAFISSMDARKYRQQPPQMPRKTKKYMGMLLPFQHGQQHQQEQTQDVMRKPVPNTRKPYCSVCKIGYADYLHHVGSGAHRKAIMRAQGNRYIMDLVRVYAVYGKKATPLTATSEEESEEDSLGRPNKKVKVDEGQRWEGQPSSQDRGNQQEKQEERQRQQPQLQYQLLAFFQTKSNKQQQKQQQKNSKNCPGNKNNNKNKIEPNSNELLLQPKSEKAVKRKSQQKDEMSKLLGLSALLELNIIRQCLQNMSNFQQNMKYRPFQHYCKSRLPVVYEKCVQQGLLTQQQKQCSYQSQ